MKTPVWAIGVTGLGDSFHDNSVCLLKNGKVFFAASEERYSRLKHDSSYPSKAMKASYDFANIKRGDIDFFASGWPQVSLFKSLRKVSIKDLINSLSHILVNANSVSFRVLYKTLVRGGIKGVSKKFRGHTLVDHYLAHASSAYRTSGIRDCLCVVWDGFGTKANGSLASGGVFICEEGYIREVETQSVQTSIGLFYEAITNSLGFTPAEGEGKTMGLAVYGNPKRFLKEVSKFAPKFEKNKWIKSKYWPDSLAATDLKYKAVYETTFMGRSLKKLVSKSAKDVAAACQYIIEREALKYFKYLGKTYKKRNFVTAGGVFLNVKMAKKTKELSFMDNYYVHPNAGDGGVALGAVLEIYSQKYRPVVYKMRSAALGDSYEDKEIKGLLKKTKGIRYFRPKNLAKYIAEKIAQGVVFGWFQGRAEWGPRALGQRSVLADPRSPKIKERINNYLKKREWFMPFAPSITEEGMGKLIKKPFYDPFMTMAFDTTKFGKKAIAAAIHIDGTTRPQIVRKRQNKLYWQVISEFEKKTGVPAVLNTSFNRHGLPIVNSPKDAIDHLLWGAVDELAIGSFIVERV